VATRATCAAGPGRAAERTTTERAAVAESALVIVAVLVSLPMLGAVVRFLAVIVSTLVTVTEFGIAAELQPASRLIMPHGH
jgi:hypothetical protein